LSSISFFVYVVASLVQKFAGCEVGRKIIGNHLGVALQCYFFLIHQKELIIVLLSGMDCPSDSVIRTERGSNSEK